MAVKKGRIRNNIRDLRVAADLTQAQLGEKIGATRQTIIAIEQEKYAPSLELAFRIANCFEVPFEAVFSYES
jgi:putative transcriptional regulator